MTRVIVCGGRNYDDRPHFTAAMKRLHKERRFTCIIEGGANGADALARAFAKLNGLESVTFPADWASFPRAAGPIRNRQMIEEGHPDLVIAFPGKMGTANMVMQARKAGVEVVEIEG